MHIYFLYEPRSVGVCEYARVHGGYGVTLCGAGATRKMIQFCVGGAVVPAIVMFCYSHLITLKGDDANDQVLFLN